MYPNAVDHSTGFKTMDIILKIYCTMLRSYTENKSFRLARS